tara:strand:+ start:2065 stop:2484 length:420 start_codon:yes stop_codon:yes gene_type:complete
MVILGCGEADDGSRSYHVLGTVKYKGKPVPAGRIDFFPDSFKGNQGPSGYATIANGHFSTLEHGKATIGGPHRMVITGLIKPDQASIESDSELLDLSLFPKYESEVDLKETKTIKEITVPLAVTKSGNKAKANRFSLGL